MYNIVIADDEAIVRTMLHSLIDCEAADFSVVFDALNGKQALDYIREKSADVLITDIKMPVMDGIELITQVMSLQNPPVIIVLSSYDEYHLVRDTFRLGAADYILKADLNSATIAQQLSAVRIQLEKRTNGNSPQIDSAAKGDTDSAAFLSDISLGKTMCPEYFPSLPFLIVQFELDDFVNQVSRFAGDIKNTLIKPLLSFARQIPQIASKCIITALSPSRYLLYCPINKDGLSIHSAEFISHQIITIWKNCMNISCCAGMSSLGQTREEYMLRMDEAAKRLTLKFLLGQSKLFTEKTEELIPIDAAVSAGLRYKGLCRAIKDMDRVLLDRMREEIITGFYIRGLEESKTECLFIIYHISIILQEHNMEFWSIFQQNENYYEKIQKQDSLRELEIWIIDYMRSLMEYMEKRYERRQQDIIIRSKQFIFDNYANPEISLNTVARYAGLSEKYFSHRFAQETGTTFSVYLTDLRIHKAKELLDKTDLKIYEISSGVGYNSTEHFTRIFKKQCAMSPVEYKKHKNI